MDAQLAGQVAEAVGRLHREAQLLGAVNLALVLAKVADKGAAGTHLHDEHQRVFVDGDPDDLDHVPVVVLAHQTRLLHELEPGLAGRLVPHRLDGHLLLGLPAAVLGQVYFSEGALSQLLHQGDRVVVQCPRGPLHRTLQACSRGGREWCFGRPEKYQQVQKMRSLQMPGDEIPDALLLLVLEVEAAISVLVDHEVLDAALVAF